jgi:hypothetical protein
MYLHNIKNSSDIRYDKIISKLIDWVRLNWDVKLKKKRSNKRKFSLPDNFNNFRESYSDEWIKYMQEEKYMDLFELFIAPIWQYGFDCGRRNFELKEYKELEKNRNFWKKSSDRWEKLAIKR